MRPIRLDVNGFASFRDPTVVDFTDAGYFAIVGPTGSGKSTVIDAMTFALYGSAPRWGSISSIQYALAPTANRCTVRLIFDVADVRYVVAREVRRVGNQIQQKNAVLERYLDPQASGDPEADEATESLASDIKEVRRLVVDLLGLEFDDFCKCVVLPQGDFALFLQASVGERQAILLKLLGASHYDAIGKVAGQQAARAQTRIDLLTGQLNDYAGATEEAESAARESEADLLALLSKVEALVPMITDEGATQVETRGRQTQLTKECVLLAGITTPAGVVELQESVTVAEGGYVRANEAQQSAGEAAGEAEEAIRSGPQRQVVEQTLREYEEQAGLGLRRGAVEEEDWRAAQARVDATSAREAADDILEKVRAERERAKSRQEAAWQAVAVVESRIALLRQTHTPEGVDQIAQRAADALTRRDEAGTTALAAESARADAHTAIESLPERSELEYVLQVVEAYARAAGRVTALRTADAGAVEQAAAARANVGLLAAQRDAARQDYEEVRSVAVAADLRPRLTVGEACPVCAQAVTTLPPPIEAPELEGAKLAHQEATARYEDATDAQVRLAAQAASVAAELREASGQVDQLDHTLASRLPDRPAGPDRDTVGDLAAVRARLDERVQAVARHKAAEKARVDAQLARQRAEDESQAVNREAGLAWAQLHTTRGPLVALGAPEVDQSNVASAWAALAGWAKDLADELSQRELTSLRSQLETAAETLRIAEGSLRDAVVAQKAAVDALTTTAIAAQRADTAWQQLVQRAAELETALLHQPPLSQLRGLLDTCELLELAAVSTRAAAQASIAARQRAERQRDDMRAEHQRARTALHRGRDAVASLGAPALDDSDLATAWLELATWAAEQAQQRHDQVTGLTSELAASVEILDRHVSALVADVAGNGIELEAHRVTLVPGRADATVQAGRVPQVVAVEVERARARTAHIVEQRADAANLRARIDAESTTRKVAAELSSLLSARRFPQWLANAALDTLVADASASLLRLSGNQFDLTHERGEFFVIDHTDADSHRSVRTLSGGETFQASLALALALSEQLATLAAGGRTTLDSIFLDEGFGTLDPDALETVAGTLENLAQGDRMVGIITHVSGLAERAPVRYEVTRDSRTSTITRAGP